VQTEEDGEDEEDEEDEEERDWRNGRRSMNYRRRTREGGKVTRHKTVDRERVDDPFGSEQRTQVEKEQVRLSPD
jgi:hypothetical protein